MPVTSSVFKKYPNPFFIETGSFAGDGIQAALDAGFIDISSIELSQELHGMCVTRFNGNPHVKLFLGDVIDCLPSILEKINQPTTFWLDAHYSCGKTVLGIYGDPIYKELEIIGAHPIKNHIILIDDMRGYDKKLFEDLVKKINPEYKITYEDGYVKEDILVAHL